jgi:hypothetical protein
MSIKIFIAYTRAIILCLFHSGDNTNAILIHIANGNTGKPDNLAMLGLFFLPIDIACFQIPLPGLQPPVTVSLLEPLSQRALIIVRIFQDGTQLLLRFSHDTCPVRLDNCRTGRDRSLPGHDPTFPKKS